MRIFVKDNWFKLTIVGIFIMVAVFIFYYLLVFIPNREQKLLIKQSQEKIRLAHEQEGKELSNPKSDRYIVTYDKDGNPLDWTVLTRASVILNDTLDTYKSALPEIQKTQAAERENLAKIYGILNNPYLENKSGLKTFITYDEAYIASGEKVIGLLTDLIKSYQGLKTAVEMRDPQLYLYYSDEIDKLEAQKFTIMTDYSNKETSKKNFAKILLAE
jgi:hypothetical protein